jgi:DNA-binding CsgD family transcriptional regulator
MYFGLLTLKGYCTPVLAFGLAAGSIRLGIAFGNSWAIVYERLPEFAERFSLIPLTSLLFAVVTVALLIPLVRQEFNIAVATSVPQTSSELEQVCSQMAEAFNLSERETGIALLVARGFSTNAIAEKLVISPHTVNTHIQHIYGKMSIHKRSELFRYINLHSEDNPLGYKR